MGSGSWTTCSYSDSISKHGFATRDALDRSSMQTVFTSSHLDKDLDPKDVIRECCDSAEHPNTVPVILALDVTGSMGQYAHKCLVALNDIISKLYETVDDIQIMTMGIGDLACDRAPIQVSQFESDERIADQLFKIYIEGGGGGNDWESYPAAWYFGMNATKLDCWNRGKKGIIITIGDEECPPALSASRLKQVMGKTSNEQVDVDVAKLYKRASEKFHIYHVSIKEGGYYSGFPKAVNKSWNNMIGENHKVISADDLPDTIVTIINKCVSEDSDDVVIYDGGISW